MTNFKNFNYELINSNQKKISKTLSKYFKEYTHHGISYHIMIFFLALCKTDKINLILESGVGPGHSSKFIAEYCKNFNCSSYSVDFNNNYIYRRVINFKKYKKSHFIAGEGYLNILKLVKKNQRYKISLLIDGPKNNKALSLIYSSFLINNNITFAVLDDVIEHSNVHKKIKKNKQSKYIYDVMKMNFIFNKNKKISLKKFKDTKTNYSNIDNNSIFQKREYIILKNDKNYLYPGLLQPKFISLLAKLNFWILIKVLVKIDTIFFKN